MTTASAHSACLEAARASALASHSAASLAAAAGYKEAARLLRSSEAVSRAAVASLTAAKNATLERSATKARQEAPSPVTAPVAASHGATPASKKKRHKKKKANMEGVVDVSDVVMGTGGGGGSASADTPTSGPQLASGSRVLAHKSSRERSPRRSTSPAVSALPASEALSIVEPCQFTGGQAVVIDYLVGKPELNGKIGTVLSVDIQSDRVAVKLDSGDSGVPDSPPPPFI